MEHLLFAAYLVLFAWLVTRVKFFTHSGLTKSQLVILFLLKVMAGVFYGWIGIYYGEMARMQDTWGYHVESLHEYELLKTHPAQFFTSFFTSSYEGGYTHFLATENSWWNDIKGNLMIKILGIFNLFSFGHYYTNVIFYSFLTLFGPIAFFRVMNSVFPGKNLVILLSTFLLPSFLYWTSGLHKEGLIFTGLALLTYHFYFGFLQRSFRWTRVLAILFSLLLVLILRNFLILGLFPALLAWCLCQRFHWKPLPVFAVVGLIFLVVFFTARYIHPELDFPAATAKRQGDFIALGGGSAVEVNRLQPNFKSFVRNAPQALSLSMIRPYPSDVKHLLSLAASLEINLLLFFFVIFLIWRIKVTPQKDFLFFCVSFSVCLLMMIGYSVNILGAIVRYRSILFPFLFVPMFVMIDWQRVSQLLSRIIRNNNNVISG